MNRQSIVPNHYKYYRKPLRILAPSRECLRTFYFCTTELKWLSVLMTRIRYDTLLVHGSINGFQIVFCFFDFRFLVDKCRILSTDENHVFGSHFRFGWPWFGTILFWYCTWIKQWFSYPGRISTREHYLDVHVSLPKMLRLLLKQSWSRLMSGVDASAVADITVTSMPIAIFAAKADVNFTHCSAIASS